MPEERTILLKLVAQRNLCKNLLPHEHRQAQVCRRQEEEEEHFARERFFAEGCRLPKGGGDGDEEDDDVCHANHEAQKVQCGVDSFARQRGGLADQLPPT